MKAIIIAAGRGARMMPYTNERPKCMLDVQGRPLLSYALDGLRGAGCSQVTVITGHLVEKIRAPGCLLVHNADYLQNNILHSLMHARADLDDDVIASYSDIYVEPAIYKRLAVASGDLVIVVDRDWKGYYEGRTEHAVAEAEKAEYVPGHGDTGTVRQMGKHLELSGEKDAICGEFLGLWKMSAAGAKRFRTHFEKLDKQLKPDAPFRAAKEWKKAYITDFLTDMIAAGEEVRCLVIERGWAELDAVQDYESLPSKIELQRLFSIAEKPASMENKPR